MEQFEAELDAIVKPVLEDDWDNMSIDPADDDDAGMGQDYKQKAMYDQLGKVLDSQGNPNPIDTVTTDDGKTFKVSGDQARVIRMLMTTDKVKPQVRTQFQRDMQNSNSAADFFDIKDYHEIPQLFVKRYLG